MRPALTWVNLCLVALGLLAVVAGRADAEPTPVRLGMSAPFSGPASDLGVDMRTGILVAFDEANQDGGVRGRPLTLESLDDGYEPGRTAPNMRRLIERDVVALIGNVGTPTAVAAIPIAIRNETPFFGAFTGAGILRRTPPDRWVVNVRAGYAEETASMVDALVEHAGLEPHEIGFFTQRDAYGDAGYVGGLLALERHGLDDETIVAHGRYERNTVDVEAALAEFLLAPVTPKAIIMVGAYEPCAAFIHLAREHGLEPLFLNVSFVGAQSMATLLGDDGEGVIVTQVVPHFDADLPIVREYREAMRTHASDEPLTFGSLEGYIASRIMIRALRRIEGDVTRDAVIDALEGLGDFDLGMGAPLSLGPGDHQASDMVWPTIIRDGRIEPFTWSELRQSFATAGDGD